MTTTTLEAADCVCGGGERQTGDGALPVNPYTGLQYHFGMLLGVDDLETAQAYPRGKIRLHNAWLHREGVVWGFDVGFNTRRELVVKPGLALDAAGHELHLDASACLDIGKWYDKHKDDEGFTFEERRGGGKRFDVHVVARFRACLARPVPAIADPCAGSELDTAFSRVSETVELLLRPGKAPAKDLGYHRLRILFLLEDDAPKYDEVRSRRQTILALAARQQARAYLDAFREFAALDEIDLAPQRDESGAICSLFPEDPTEIVLADVLGIEVEPAAGVGAISWSLADPLPAPNVRVRRSHVATATIQELLCGPLFASFSTATPPEDPSRPPTPGPTPETHDVPDAGGPRVDAESVKIKSRRRIILSVDKPVDAASVRPEQFRVSTYASSTGWSSLDINDTQPDAAGTTIAIELKESIPTDQIIRLVARGTGPQPILGTDFVPLAGAVGGPSGSADDGHDFVIMLRRS